MFHKKLNFIQKERFYWMSESTASILWNWRWCSKRNWKNVRIPNVSVFREGQIKRLQSYILFKKNAYRLWFVHLHIFCLQFLFFGIFSFFLWLENSLCRTVGPLGCNHKQITTEFYKLLAIHQVGFFCHAF